MHIEQLRYFTQIHKFGSINRVAEQAHTSPQAISASIKRLEEELDCRLFIREGTKNLTLSPHGKLLLNGAEDILRILEETTNKLNALTLSETLLPTTEQIDIFVSPAIDLSITPTAIDLFLQKNPHAKVKVMQQEAQEIHSLVLNGNSLGIVISFSTRMTTDKIVYQLIATDKCCAAVSPNHPLAKQKSVSLKTLLKYPLAIYQSNYNCTNPLCYVLEEKGTPNYHTITNNNIIYQNVINNNQHIISLHARKFSHFISQRYAFAISLSRSNTNILSTASKKYSALSRYLSISVIKC